MGTGMRVAAVVALLAAIGAAFALPRRGRPGTAGVPQPDGEAAAAVASGPAATVPAGSMGLAGPVPSPPPDNLAPTP